MGFSFFISSLVRHLPTSWQPAFRPSRLIHGLAFAYKALVGTRLGFSAFIGFVLIFDLYVFWVLCTFTHITSNKLNLMKIT